LSVVSAATFSDEVRGFWCRSSSFVPERVPQLDLGWWRDHSGVTTAATFAEFGAREAQDVSPAHERLSAAVSGDEQVLTLLGTLPPSSRQPNLLFGVVRLLGGPVHDPAAFHDYAVANWPAIEAKLRTRTVVFGVSGGHRGWSTLILLICGSVGAAGAGAG
jgi:Uncharacterized protein conserved in bacteria (DUF2332)